MRSAAIALHLVIAAVSVNAAEPLVDCSDQVVQYTEPHLAPLAKHVFVNQLPQRPSRVIKEKDPEFTPNTSQQTMAFNRVVVADTMKPGPYTNVIEVFPTRGDSASWRIEIAGLKDNVRLKWVNEDLLFIQAWWGRIVSTDMIFEVSRGRFIYAKEANYGLPIQPCKEPTPSVKDGRPAANRP